jgi:hypothetical protein
MTKIYTLLLILLLGAYVMLSFAAGHCFGDVHLVNRMGASLSAIGALMIVFQVYREISFEHQNRNDQVAVEEGRFLSLDRSRVEAIRSQRALERHRQRMRIIVCVAIMVFMGEVLHGWGDLILVRIAGDDH